LHGCESGTISEGEGNGRAQLTFIALLADQAGHPLDLRELDARAILAAMVKSEAPLSTIIQRLAARE
jgi:cell filamentation protein